MINCEETAYLADKSGLEKISFLEKLNLKMHVFICKTCRNYFKDSKSLNKIFNQTSFNNAKLSENDKEVMKETISKSDS